MVQYQMEYVSNEIYQNAPTIAQLNLKKLVGTDFTQEEAAFIWERVVDHQWQIGERLKRDVGLRVAAIDYVENIFDPSDLREDKRGGETIQNLRQLLARAARVYFISKSKTLF